MVSAADYGTGTTVEPSPYREEDEQRDAEIRAQVDEMDMVERQWAAHVREQAAHGHTQHGS